MSLRITLQNLPARRLIRLAAVLAVAVAAGHLAQTLAAHKGGGMAFAQADVVPTHIVQLSSEEQQNAAIVVVPKPALQTTSVAPVCPVTLTLGVLPRAMLSLALTAPCHDGQRVVLHQAGLAITGRIAADGTLALRLPVFTADGAVAVQFADGSRVEQALPVPEAARYRRFGVQWQGADGFRLHGLESGADFGQPGDVWAKSSVGAGSLTVLGDATVENPLLAQVYTYPAEPGIKPEIVLEAAVLAETCGHDLLGDVLTSEGGQVQSTDLTVAMPDCSGVGDFLVLKNLASDVKIAAN